MCETTVQTVIYQRAQTTLCFVLLQNRQSSCYRTARASTCHNSAFTKFSNQI